MHGVCKVPGCRGWVEVFIGHTGKGLCERHWVAFCNRYNKWEEKAIEHKRLNDPVEKFVRESIKDSIELHVCKKFRDVGLGYEAPILGKEYKAPQP